RTQERDLAPHVVNLNILTWLTGFFVDGPFEHQEIAVRLCRDAARSRMIGRDLQRFGVLHQWRARIGVREHEARHAIGECCLADAGWTCNQPGMGETATPISAKQRLLSLAVAVQHACLARGRRLEVVGFLDTHDTAPAGRLEMRAGSSRSTTVRHIHSATTGFASVASIAT